MPVKKHLRITEIRTTDDGTVWLRSQAGHWYAIHRSGQYSSATMAEPPEPSPQVHTVTVDTLLRRRLPLAF